MKDLIEYYEQRSKKLHKDFAPVYSKEEFWAAKLELNLFMASILNCSFSEINQEIELIKSTFKK